MSDKVVFLFSYFCWMMCLNSVEGVRVLRWVRICFWVIDVIGFIGFLVIVGVWSL